MDIKLLYTLLPLLIGWTADKLFGDPRWLPHPVVAMGKIIAWGEKQLNKGNKRMMKGALFSIILILSSFLIVFFIIKGLDYLSPYLSILFSSVVVFFCLAGKTLIDEVRNVFAAVDSSVEEGRKQVARIVGRDTSALSPQQIRTAALETLSENLSDGVIAPLFWFILLGVPGMFAYKMVNTLDSMIGYKSDRYKQFGCWAARIDDVANYIPARLTSLLMIVVSGKISLLSFVRKFGSQHASPNSGYPEAALAGILNCRFGGSNVYFGQRVEKPYIGYNEKELTYTDLKIAVRVNIRTEILMVFAVCVDLFLLSYF
ncbi:MAG: cobalamin biosynthesis protein CobD [Dysgonomonas mossii]|uniref:adenosylcobinamide-phosphate synthase CbiB n=1 Tax=Dysgonomonas mossii TaxID=163665 RepID=UPI001E0DE318|nr:adenosylcobinamide-phosphate synthase CbiB [Dysgonomonas mossii]MBS5795113.1 cobalamin biosynthesis protein CobD [Dysgonomonas mossii]MBS7109641.1 cobalamin biosynthesis protein CobD [Dysgonomonas mossii]